jgi:hypothetical protein
LGKLGKIRGVEIVSNFIEGLNFGKADPTAKGLKTFRTHQINNSIDLVLELGSVGNA